MNYLLNLVLVIIYECFVDLFCEEYIFYLDVCVVLKYDICNFI